MVSLPGFPCSFNLSCIDYNIGGQSVIGPNAGGAGGGMTLISPSLPITLNEEIQNYITTPTRILNKYVEIISVEIFPKIIYPSHSINYKIYL